jgi:hypothetical protein
LEALSISEKRELLLEPDSILTLVNYTAAARDANRREAGENIPQDKAA